MARRVWMLELDRSSWRLVAVDGENYTEHAQVVFKPEELSTQVQAIQESMRSAGYRSEPVVVALTSSWCLSARLPIAKSSELRDRKTLLYRFEECVPWNMEDCVADFYPADDAACVVAVPVKPLADFLVGLENLGICIQAVVPKSLLAVAEILSALDRPDRCVLALEDGEGIDLLLVEHEHPLEWLQVPSAGRNACQEISRWELESGRGLPVIACGLSETVLRRLTENCAAVAESPVADISGHLTRSAFCIGSGVREPLIDLKREAFGRSGSNRALSAHRIRFRIAAAALAIALSAAFIFRGQVAARESQLVAAKQADVFHQVFPDATVPVGVKGRLESEVAKLRGLQSDTAQPTTVSAVGMFRDLLVALPADRRYTLQEIRLEEGRISVDGEVRDHGDAELIAQRVRQKGFEVPAPRTQRLDDKRVSLRIAGNRQIAPPVASRRAP